eukprot:718734_1
MCNLRASILPLPATLRSALLAIETNAHRLNELVQMSKAFTEVKNHDHQLHSQMALKADQNPRRRRDTYMRDQYKKHYVAVASHHATGWRDPFPRIVQCVRDNFPSP